jgi:hypothetical protein
MADKPAAQHAQIGDLGVRVPIRHIAALGTLAVFGFLWLGRGLPDTAWLASDSASYLDFSPVRPHGYAAFLAAYRLLFDDFAYLPAVQLGCYVAAVWLLATGVALRTQNVIAAATTLVVALWLTDTTGFPYVLSDSLYAALLVTAVASFLFYAETGRAGALVAASAAIGAALTFRTIGLALLPAFLIAAFIPSLTRRRHLLLTAGLILLPIAGFYGAAAASQLAHNHRFVLGSWGGMDILGKVPLLSRPVPPDSPYARLNGIVDAMQPARAQLARLDPLLEALTARQYYEHLRWDVVRPSLKESWPDWRDADEYGRGQLAARLAAAYAAQDPVGLLHRTAIDLLGLWVMPRWLTEGEQEAMQAELDNTGGLPVLAGAVPPADAATEAALDYYKIVPDPIDPVRVIGFRIVVIAFWVFSLGFVVLLAVRPSLRAWQVAPDLLLILLAVHAVYLGTALMEGVHERYVMPAWPLLVAAPILALGLLFRTRRYRKRFSGQTPATASVSSGTQLGSSNTLAGNGSP